MEGKKKRQRKERQDDYSSDDMMDDIQIDQQNLQERKRPNNYANDNEEMNDIMYTDFIFSGLKDSYFHNIKTLIKPLFDFESVNCSRVADFILSLKQDIGSTVKNEDEEETKNLDNEFKSTSQQLFNFIMSKIESFSSNQNDKQMALSIINTSRFAFLINERVINLPQEAIPIALSFLLREMEECREEEGYDRKFELDYIVVINKFVKKTVNDNVKKGKKVKQDLNNLNSQQEEILNYKYESDLFNQKSVVSIGYKIPYEKMNMEYLENSNEPQFFGLSFLRYQDFIDVVTSMNSEN